MVTGYSEIMVHINGVTLINICNVNTKVQEILPFQRELGT